MSTVAMSRLVFTTLACLAGLAAAKPWQGIHPGISSTLDVFGKFGEPTAKTELKGQLTLVYSGLQAPGGTVQVQFKLAPGTDTVARIDVYPAPLIDKDAIEKSYGPKCDAKATNEPCYFVKDAGKKQYLVFAKLGLAVFFKDDGYVLSLAFIPGK